MRKGFSPLVILVIVIAVIAAAVVTVYFTHPEILGVKGGGTAGLDEIMSVVPKDSVMIFASGKPSELIELELRPGQENQETYAMLNAVKSVAGKARFAVFYLAAKGTEGGIILGGDSDTLADAVKKAFEDNGKKVTEEKGVYSVEKEVCFGKASPEVLFIGSCPVTRTYIEDFKTMEPFKVPDDVKSRLGEPGVLGYVNLAEFGSTGGGVQSSPMQLEAEQVWTTMSGKGSRVLYVYDNEVSAKKDFDKWAGKDFESKLFQVKRTSRLSGKIIDVDMEYLPGEVTYKDYGEYDKYVLRNPDTVILAQGLQDLGNIEDFLPEQIMTRIRQASGGTVDKIIDYVKDLKTVVVSGSGGGRALIAIESNRPNDLVNELKEYITPISGNPSQEISWETSTINGWTVYSIHPENVMSEVSGAVAVKGGWVLAGDKESVENVISGQHGTISVPEGLPTNYPIYMQVTQSMSPWKAGIGKKMYVAVGPNRIIVRGPKEEMDLSSMPKKIGSPLLGYGIISEEKGNEAQIEIQGNILSLGTGVVGSALLTYLWVSPLTSGPPSYGPGPAAPPTYGPGPTAGPTQKAVGIMSCMLNSPTNATLVISNPGGIIADVSGAEVYEPGGGTLIGKVVDAGAGTIINPGKIIKVYVTATPPATLTTGTKYVLRIPGYPEAPFNCAG